MFVGWVGGKYLRLAQAAGKSRVFCEAGLGDFPPQVARISIGCKILGATIGFPLRQFDGAFRRFMLIFKAPITSVEELADFSTATVSLYHHP